MLQEIPQLLTLGRLARWSVFTKTPPSTTTHPRISSAALPFTPPLITQLPSMPIKITDCGGGGGYVIFVSIYCLYVQCNTVYTLYSMCMDQFLLYFWLLPFLHTKYFPSVRSFSDMVLHYSPNEPSKRHNLNDTGKVLLTVVSMTPLRY